MRSSLVFTASCTELYINSVKVTLRLTVSQSVNLGVELHLGPLARYYLLFDSCGLVLLGALSDERTALGSTVFLGSESLGTRDHILLSQI
jgi:hypothetical protein